VRSNFIAGAINYLLLEGTNMSSYVIYHYDITDRSQIDELTRLSLPVNEKYNAKVAIGSPVKALEGTTFTHIVMLEFKNFDAAKEYYYSEEHKEITVLREKITSGWATIVPGDSETQSVVDSGYFNA